MPRPGAAIEPEPIPEPVVEPEPIPEATVEPEPTPEPETPRTDIEPGLFDDLGSLPLTMENVQEVLDDMVRPALQADGGDITLVKIDGNDIFVRLVGACSTCPSSVMTMKMGVERLLQEEFPQMGDLIQVDDYIF